MIDITATSEAIKSAIRDSGETVKSVAEKLYVSPMAVYKWTYGMSLPTVDNFVGLSEITGKTIDEMIVRAE